MKSSTAGNAMRTQSVPSPVSPVEQKMTQVKSSLKRRKHNQSICRCSWAVGQRQIILIVEVLAAPSTAQYTAVADGQKEAKRMVQVS